MKASFGTVASLLAASAAAYPQVLQSLSSSDQSALRSYGEQAAQAAANPQAVKTNPGMSRSAPLDVGGGNADAA